MNSSSAWHITIASREREICSVKWNNARSTSVSNHNAKGGLNENETNVGAGFDLDADGFRAGSLLKGNERLPFLTYITFSLCPGLPMRRNPLP
jgi:hypothetical protein